MYDFILHEFQEQANLFHVNKYQKLVSSGNSKLTEKRE